MFEDDQAFAAMVEHLLKREGHQVSVHSKWPLGGLEALRNELKREGCENIDLAIIDYHLPVKNGLAICQELKSGAFKDMDIVFISGESSKDIIVDCYKANATDFIQKPINPDQLAVKLDHLCHQAIQHQSLKQAVSESRDIAMKAMSTSSELGQIIQFLESSFESKTYQEVAKGLFKVLKPTGLHTTIKIYHSKGHDCFFYDDQCRDIESQVIDSFRESGRIYDFSRRTVFNYPHISLLVKNMPDSKADSYGKFKDNICLLLNGAEARIAAIETDYEAERQRQQITTTSHVITMMIDEIENSNVELSAQFQRALEKLEVEMFTKIMHFNLLESEENALMEVLSRSVAEAGAIFDRSIEQEKRFKSIMHDLAKSLQK